ncbi:MAG: hypothetical protein MHMPM18_000616 [Marteilia pararefringens]
MDTIEARSTTIKSKLEALISRAITIFETLWIDILKILYTLFLIIIYFGFFKLILLIFMPYLIGEAVIAMHVFLKFLHFLCWLAFFVIKIYWSLILRFVQGIFALICAIQLFKCCKTPNSSQIFKAFRDGAGFC